MITLKNTFGPNLIFHPGDLVDIEEVHFIPVIAQGIRIRHNNPNYKKNVIFWSLTGPGKIIRVIKNKKLFSPDESGSTKEDRVKRDLNSHTIQSPNPYIFVASIIVILLCAGFGLYSNYHKFDDYIIVRKASEIHLEVKDIWVDHGTAYLNDSIIVPGGTKLISEQPEWFKLKDRDLFGRPLPIKPSFAELDQPFVINKASNTFDLKVIKFDDTLLFRIPDPDYKDPNDPTFQDVFDKLFGEK